MPALLGVEATDVEIVVELVAGEDGGAFGRLAACALLFPAEPKLAWEACMEVLCPVLVGGRDVFGGAGFGLVGPC